MLTNYKFCRIQREDDVHINECVIRFYEGEITTQNEYNPVDGVHPVTKYRIIKALEKADMPHHASSKSNGDCIIYTEEDFGVISTDDELRDFLDEEISKDSAREPIPEQDKRILNKTKR